MTIMKIKKNRIGLNFIIIKLSGTSFTRFSLDLVMTIESLYQFTVEFSKLLLP